MKIKMILPALTEALSPFFRPLKYSLFPPLGLATLAGYVGDEHEITIQDEHVQRLTLDDDPQLVVIQVYAPSARRAYAIADRYRRRGAYVCLGGLHVTSLPDEAAAHADTIFTGPGEDTWPAFLKDFAAGRPLPVYRSTVRTLIAAPRPRRELFDRRRYLVPNTIIVSRGCPHRCEFCYKDAFFAGGKSFYTMAVDQALAEVDALSGRHVYFLDDHLMGDVRFASALFEGMRGMNRIWQAAGTVESVLRPGLLEEAVAAGLRSLFIGFETLCPSNLRGVGKTHNLGRDYAAAVRRLHDLGVMINASFVFGLDGDDESVFDRTVDWAVAQGIETCTFHVLTPYPGTATFGRLESQRRILTRDWNLYDARHAVYRPANMTPIALEEGRWAAYRRFYTWPNIVRAAWHKNSAAAKLQHLLYSGGWKKFEDAWNVVIKLGALRHMIGLLEYVLGSGKDMPAPAVDDAVHQDDRRRPWARVASPTQRPASQERP